MTTSESLLVDAKAAGDRNQAGDALAYAKAAFYAALAENVPAAAAALARQPDGD